LSALTKMFIVLQLVFSLVCAVLLVLFISKTENYKTTVAAVNARDVGLQVSYGKAESARSAAEAKATALQAQFNDAMNKLGTANDALAEAKAKGGADLAALQAKFDAISADNATVTASNKTYAAIIDAYKTELDKLRPQVSELTKQYGDIYRAKNEVDNQLKAAEQSIRKLQVMLAQGGGGSAGAVAPLGSDGQIQVLTASNAATGGKVNGRISDVALTQGRTLIEMPLGERDGLKVGTKMYVYRDSGYVGDATVERVSTNQAVAVVVSTKPGETVKIGDLVSTVGQ
jgi:prefoldin subunit 5